MPTDKNITRIIDTSSYKPFNNESIENEELIYKLDDIENLKGFDLFTLNV